jgi:hypothetical protein
MMNEANDDRRETELARWHDVVTQVDWGGQVMQESWYGHRYPCRRLALWIHFSSFVGCLTLAFQGFSSWPILRPYLTMDQLRDIQDSHAACFESLCRAVESISFTCEMNDDAQIIIVDHPWPTERVALPDECHAAIEKTFGKGSEHKLLASRNDHKDGNNGGAILRELDLLQFGDISKNANNIPIFQIRTEDCLAQERLLEYLASGSMFSGSSSMSLMVDLVDSADMKPGDRETVHLRSYVCPKSMPRFISQEVIPQWKLIYKAFMKWRRAASVGLMYFFHMFFYSANCATNMLFLLVPAVLMWRFLPNNEIRGHRITMFHTVTTLLILVSLTEVGTTLQSETIRTCILVMSALSFGNSKAAVEWCFLYVASFVEADRIDWGIPLEWLLALDPTKKVVPWVTAVILVLIPGDGLLKLVSLYVLYMAFPRVANARPGMNEQVEENHDKQE